MTARLRTRAVSAAALALFSLAASSAYAQDLAPPSTGAPPDPGAPTAPLGGTTPAATSQPEEARLDDDKKKDSGRGLEWVYLNADAGFSYINMTGLSSTDLALVNATSAGSKFGVGAGIRLFILSLGGRATFNELSSFNLWQIDGEIGFHIPIGHWEPYFGLHGGYCFVGALDDGLSGAPSISVTGGDAGLQLGLDYYFNHFVSLGVDLSGNALILHRDPSPLPAAATSVLSPQQQAAYQQSSDDVGFGLGAALRLGLHL